MPKPACLCHIILMYNITPSMPVTPNHCLNREGLRQSCESWANIVLSQIVKAFYLEKKYRKEKK